MALSLNSIFPIITTTISFLFFVSILEQYRRKRKAHQLVWAVALFLFMITAVALALRAAGFLSGLGYTLG